MRSVFQEVYEGRKGIGAIGNAPVQVVLTERAEKMDFSNALVALKLGLRIKRKHWEGYWFMPGFVAFGEWDYAPDGLDGATLITDVILVRLAEGGYAVAQAYQEDLLARDWEVAE